MSRYALITGAKSGIGNAIGLAFSRGEDIMPVGYDLPEYDVMAPQTVRYKPISILINCAGVNHLDWLEDYPESEWDRVMGVNAKGIYLMTRHYLPDLIQTRGTILNIVSDAAHRPMRASIAYNASKAAAHIMTQQMARELTRRYGITVFGIAPAHVAGTGMSLAIEEEARRVRGWSPEETRRRALDGSVTGEPISVETLAEFVAFLLSTRERHRALSGCVLPYGANL